MSTGPKYRNVFQVSEILCLREKRQIRSVQMKSSVLKIHLGVDPIDRSIQNKRMPDMYISFQSEKNVASYRFHCNIQI